MSKSTETECGPVWGVVLVLFILFLFSYRVVGCVEHESEMALEKYKVDHAKCGEKKK